MNKTLLLVFTNLITLGLLILLILREKYPQKFLEKMRGNASVDQPLYLMNKEYHQQTDLYRLYQKKGRVVMLGNSITYRVRWNELLNRDDVLNRGIDSDLTEGFKARLDEIIDLEPDLCFILGGANDLMKDIPTDTVLANLATLVHRLQAHKVRPIIQSILHVGQGVENASSLNERIKTTNLAIEAWCKREGVFFLDLNEKMQNPGFLKAEYTTDGVHLTAKGYDRWRSALLPLLPALDH
jgi:lysophospholipase L1-like esterase